MPQFETQATIRTDLDAFTRYQASNREDLDEVIDTYHVSESSLGHDFYLTRNGHGAGFWDRGYDLNGLGDKLSEAARPYGSMDLYIGDDGKAYVYG